MTKYPSLALSSTWQQSLPYIMLIASAVGLVASLALSYDKMQVLADPTFQPGCNINPILSCGSVMSTTQAEIAGIPNTFFGLIAFGGLSGVAASLLAGATFKRWFWIAVHAISAMGVGFMLYLFFQSVFRIHAICPWCFFVWLVTFPVFLAVSVYTIREHIYHVPRNIIVALVMYGVQKHPGKILAAWYAVLFGILLTHFWYYWSTLL
ncbi:MAG TPA: vitamin K epoxide reductase family protein [Candidatus Saccharimonadales bacterium]|nr:vitamin K epoxide reductase family protein [Candidatus Saccharimonadales bacterium]